MKPLRLVFAAVVLVLPVELAVAAVWSEPYPAIFQPAFRGVPQANGEIKAVRPRVTVEFDSGEVRDVPFRDVLPKSDSLATDLFRSGYGTTERANSPETVALLRESLASRFDDTATRVIVTWENFVYDISDGSERVSSVDRTVIIDLEGKL